MTAKQKHNCKQTVVANWTDALSVFKQEREAAIERPVL